LNREDIVRIAREAGLFEAFLPETLERFAALVIQHKALDQLTAAGQYEEGFEAGAAAEREACAKVCDVLADKHTFEGGYANECAEAIRARGTNV
jgi:hypothetical protein